MTIDTRALPDLLCWYEGMLLLPEHFQAASRRQEMLGGYLGRAVAPHGWGIRELATEIVDGVFRVKAIEAVMPDGLVVRYPGDDPDEPPLEADLKPKKPLFEQRAKLVIHLIVTAWSADVLDQTGPEAGALARYRSVRGKPLERDDSDVATGDAASEAMRERPWLRPILRLHVGDGGMVAPPAKYVALPIARVHQSPDAAIVADRYDPPRTRIGAAGELYDCAHGVSRELRNKATFLSERLKNEQGVPERGGAQDTHSINAQLRLLNRRFQALQRNTENLQALVRTVPRLEALAKDAEAHPFVLYLTLCDVVGDLAMLGGELTLPDVPVYEHRDPLASYDVLERHILRMLESLNQRYRVAAFDRINEGRFELTFKPGDLGTQFVLGAVRAKGEAASPVSAWMSGAMIATAERLPDLKRRRVGGAVRRPIDRDEPLDLAPPTLTSLFRVEVAGESIDRRETMLVVENPDPEGPMSILLYIPRDVIDADAPHAAP